MSLFDVVTLATVAWRSWSFCTAGPSFLCLSAQIEEEGRGVCEDCCGLHPALCFCKPRGVQEAGRPGFEWASGSKSTELFPPYFPLPENNVYELKMSVFLQRSCSCWPFHWVQFLSPAFKLWLNLFTFSRPKLCTKISWALLLKLLPLLPLLKLATF